MKKFIIITGLLISFINVAYSQGITDIQFLRIKDSSFIKNVTEIIETEKNSEDNQHFFRRGLGYIAVTISGYNRGDTLLKYIVLPMLSIIGKNDGDLFYPMYYSYIDGRPILIYMPSLKSLSEIKFSKKSKKLISKIIQPYLEKPKDVQLYYENGKKAFRDKKFRIDYINFSLGKAFYLTSKQWKYY